MKYEILVQRVTTFGSKLAEALRIPKNKLYRSVGHETYQYVRKGSQFGHAPC